MSEARVRRRPIVQIVFALVLVAAAQAQGPSEPPIPFPALPEVDLVGTGIGDLDEAPAVAREAIVQLVTLGAYPLTADMRALPNEPLDLSTAAYMLVNLFAPELGEQFPLPAAEALAILSDVTGFGLAPDTIATAGALRGLLLAIVDLPPPAATELREVLNAQYPALEAGNADAPLTRAGGAVMLVLALDHLAAAAP